MIFICKTCSREWSPRILAGGRWGRGSFVCPHCGQKHHRVRARKCRQGIVALRAKYDEADDPQKNHQSITTLDKPILEEHELDEE
jgi:predicted RNA-binding Zn-ribbon protein involved in translation (DUF1610 family)